MRQSSIEMRVIAWEVDDYCILFRVRSYVKYQKEIKRGYYLMQSYHWLNNRL